ncbi:nucleolar complex protein [Pseudomassariella vexata]|uniref:Nucleolar complex protein n=1 Tax=Pseudomassariella vexata TaxID=1141098 RepID=A0A1Y2E411_9PEZI|nr:nucleolar complex protein [Pseudomassariella vexata]ORY66293.1 nucleolar complex protein [Pseudomassariella vexata]
MPGKVPDSSLKRKRSKSEEKAKKRAKSESSDEGDAHANILLLENDILESRKNYNNITALLEIAKKKDDSESALIATISLCRVFLRLLASSSLTRNSGQSEKEIVVINWLKGRLGEYKQVILAALCQDETATTGLTLAMRILKAEGQYLSNKEEYTFPKVFLKDIVDVLILNGSEDMRQEFCEKFVGEFRDVRFYTFKALKEILSNEDHGSCKESLFDNAFDILSFFEDVPAKNEDLGGYYLDAPKKKNHPVVSLSQHQRRGQEAWLALLGLGPNRDQRKKVLGIMTTSIAPWFTKPELLADFLTDSYDSGGTVSLLALSGVYYLIQHRNLDYPSFYRKLYSLLDADILHSKHRSKFLRLLETFLASTHLPAALVASFVKKISRLCLNAPPAAIVAVIPWIYNVFKSHPQCTFMIHRVPRTPEDKALIETEGLADPFIADEQDPMETQAIDSCLWEVVQLQSHYHPNVATIAKIISEQFTKQSYNMEDFLDHSYSSLLDAELSKHVKKAPVVEFMIPKRIFLPQDSESGVEANLLTKLWDFN